MTEPKEIEKDTTQDAPKVVTPPQVAGNVSGDGSGSQELVNPDGMIAAFGTEPNNEPAP